MTKQTENRIKKLRQRIWVEFLGEVEELYRRNYTIYSMSRILQVQVNFIKEALKK
jgi:hypothetical protein